MAVLDDLAGYIDSSSTLFTLNTNLGKAVSLDAGTLANTFTVLYETPGLEGAQTFSTAANLTERVFDRPRVQAISRSTSYATARSRAQTIYDLLDGLNSRGLPSTTGTQYLSITAVQPPFSLGRDSNDRYLVACNYQIERDR